MVSIAITMVVLLAWTSLTAADPLDEPCELDIPAWALREGEPDLTVDYTDCYNMGCQNVCPVEGGFGHVFQLLDADPTGRLTLHGPSGWYRRGVTNERDVDWFIARCGAEGRIGVIIDAEYPVTLFQTTTDCAGVEALQEVISGPCDRQARYAYAEPGGPVWLEVMPATYQSPDGDGYGELDARPPRSARSSRRHGVAAVKRAGSNGPAAAR